MAGLSKLKKAAIREECSEMTDDELLESLTHLESFDLTFLSAARVAQIKFRILAIKDQMTRDLSMLLSMGATYMLKDRFDWLTFEQIGKYIRDKVEGNELEEWELAIDDALEKEDK